MYLFLVFCKQEEARRIALKHRAEQTSQSEELGWEEEGMLPIAQNSC